MSTEFNDHPLIDLEKLFLGDQEEILLLQQEFETNGWCFVLLSQDVDLFKVQMNQINQSLSNFFTLKQNEKTRYLSSNVFGYTRVNHKEGITILTDQHGNADSHYILPVNIDATLQQVSQLISNLTYRLQPIITKLIRSDHKATKQVELSNHRMFDIVYYFNEKTGPTTIPEIGYDINEVNCVPHYDPGLFSLNILSTCDGLQLKDQSQNQWIDGPDNSQVDQSNIGVIWLGEAASILTENRFKAGIHRVIYPCTPHQTRLTIWQEVCTESQIKQLLEQGNNVQRLPPGAKVMLANQPNSKPMRVLPGGETPRAFMKRVESERGLSLSKSSKSDIRVFPKALQQTNSGGLNSQEGNHFVRLKTKK